jgi:hypothetical protein
LFRAIAGGGVSAALAHILARVRFLAYRRIKPHAPPLVRTPVNSFEFQPCGRTPQVGNLTPSLGHRHQVPATSFHRLRRGLPGYLILFDPRAFVPQRRSRPSWLPPRSVFLAISKHFTATLPIPPTPAEPKPGSINGRPPVEPVNFTADFPGRLRTL